MDVADTRPLIVDQPDENLDNESIYELLTTYFKTAKRRRQIILITHNPNLVVNADSEQVIVATAERHQNGLPHITYQSGALENNMPEEQGIRQQVCRMLWAAYRNPKARHLARFILVALYTGTRSEAILRLRFMPHTAGGHVDTEASRIYRRGAGQTETKKRQPPIPIPNKLRAHLRRWERNGARFVVDVDGQRVGSVKTAWRTALTEAGIEHCTRHDLRHTAITWAMQRGIDKWTAAGFFGVTLEVLEGTYGHHHPDYLQGAVEAMDRRA